MAILHSLWKPNPVATPLICSGIVSPNYKQGNRFFDGACKFFFVKLMEFNKFPKSQAFMINLKSYAGDPVLPFIECAIPSEESDGCKISDWSANIPQIDGQNERVFLEFSE